MDARYQKLIKNLLSMDQQAVAEVLWLPRRSEVERRLWPAELQEAVVANKASHLLRAAYYRATRCKLLNEVDDLFVEAVIQFATMLKEGKRPFDREKGSTSDELLCAYENAIQREDWPEAARLKEELVQWAHRAVRSAFLITPSLRRALKRRSRFVAKTPRAISESRATIADGLELSTEDSCETRGARARLKDLLDGLQRKDQVALIAYCFRNDPAEHLAVCKEYDLSLCEDVEETLNNVSEETLKKRFYRARRRVLGSE